MDFLATLLPAVQNLLARKPYAVIALDGMAASGKTTLAEALADQISHSAVVHMDDFMTPFEDRFPGYFEASLSNVDLTRFDREVLTPFQAHQPVVYRPYRCHPTAMYLSSVTLPADTRLLIVEGAYSLHPQLASSYDLRVLCTITPELQRTRILARNGEAQLERYLTRWIPMELAHIHAHALLDSCDLHLIAE